MIFSTVKSVIYQLNKKTNFHQKNNKGFIARHECNKVTMSCYRFTSSMAVTMI
jgi:hypothetical protein